jgi:hypothetical protein
MMGDNMEHFDITMTATLRPELIKRTIISFHENLFGDWLQFARIYVNVDDTGCDDEKEKIVKYREIETFLKEYFYPVHVSINYKDPHFPSAWFWCISHTKSRLVFHLEEDWELNYKLDFEKMYGAFYKYPDLKHLRLSLFKSDDKAIKMWQKHFALWNGDFFKVEEKSVIPVGWCGHPSLNDGNWLRDIASQMDKARNPEKQFHYGSTRLMSHYIVGNDYGLFQPQSSPPALKEIGRQWMHDHGYKKAGGANCEYFTHWVKKGEQAYGKTD